MVHLPSHRWWWSAGYLLFFNIKKKIVVWTGPKRKKKNKKERRRKKEMSTTNAKQLSLKCSFSSFSRDYLVCGKMRHTHQLHYWKLIANTSEMSFLCYRFVWFGEVLLRRFQLKCICTHTHTNTQEERQMRENVVKAVIVRRWMINKCVMHFD